MNLSTSLSELSYKEIQALNFCLSNSCRSLLGDNGKNTRLRSYAKSHPEKYGEFKYNLRIISIYRGSCRTVDRYVRVFIHEWIHSIQPGIRENYARLNDELGYEKNPFEIEAREGEKKYKKVIWKTTKLQMKEKFKMC